MKLIVPLICLGLGLFAGTGPATAQETNPPPASSVQTNQPLPNQPLSGTQAGISQPGRTAQITFKTPYELYLTLLTVALGIAFALLFCLIHWLGVADEAFSRSYIVLVVVFAALFLIVAGYSQEQVAPVFGLPGSIVGYIFGRLSSEIQQKINTGEKPAVRARVTSSASAPLPAAKTTGV